MSPDATRARLRSRAIRAALDAVPCPPRSDAEVRERAAAIVAEYATVCAAAEARRQAAAARGLDRSPAEGARAALAEYRATLIRRERP